MVPLTIRAPPLTLRMRGETHRHLFLTGTSGSSGGTTWCVSTLTFEPDCLLPPTVEILPRSPWKEVDVGRETIFPSLFGGSQTIEDTWDGASPEDRRELEDCWTGETKFWSNDVKTLDDFRADAVGRKTRQQTTTRVPWIDPDT